MQGSLLQFQAPFVRRIPAAGLLRSGAGEPGKRPGNAERGQVFGATTGILTLYDKGASPSPAGDGDLVGGARTAREHGASADREAGRYRGDVIGILRQGYDAVKLSKLWDQQQRMGNQPPVRGPSAR